VQREYAYDFATRLLCRFVLVVMGSQVIQHDRVTGHYGHNISTETPAIEFLQEANIDQVLKLTRIGGHESFKLADMDVPGWFQYSESKYLADRMMDDIFLTVHIDELQGDDKGIQILDWKINNSRRPERIMAASKDYKSQMSLAKEGHWRFVAARRSAMPQAKATSSGATGASGGKRKATEGGEGEAPLSSGLPSARGERRGLSDIDEEDAGMKQSHSRYVTQTTSELKEKFESKPKRLVNYHLSHGAGRQTGRLIGSFMLHHQHEVASWRNEVPSQLAELRTKYREYVDTNPGAACTELDVVEEAIAWVDKIVPILARPVPPPPPAFVEDDDDVHGAASSSSAKPPPGFDDEEDEDE